MTRQYVFVAPNALSNQYVLLVFNLIWPQALLCRPLPATIGKLWLLAVC